jgi:signal transduction histidine kinase
VFLTVLAALPPRLEWHKQVIILAIGIVQLLETKIISAFPKRGVFYVILLKILLATVLIDHTGEVGINSSYYPIYYLPVVTAALYCGPWLTLFWTLLASAAYCSYLYPAMEEYELTPEALPYLALRIMFFFLAAMVVNRFAQQSQQQTRLYRELAERLAETNRRLEQAQAEARRSERLAALGQLSAGLAHEIRNPLGVIKGSAEMLTQKLQASDALARELAGYISTEVNRLSDLVTEFLDFARPLHAEPHPADLIALLDRVLQIVADRFAGKQSSGTQETRKPVRVERHYASGLPLVPLDESLCEQAFLNLVQNAYEAMQDGDHGGTLRVDVQPAIQNDREGVELSLADTGPGVPEELREEIFNPFVTTKKTGVGLGLSIMGRFASRMLRGAALCSRSSFHLEKLSSRTRLPSCAWLGRARAPAPTRVPVPTRAKPNADYSHHRRRSQDATAAGTEPWRRRLQDALCRRRGNRFETACLRTSSPCPHRPQTPRHERARISARRQAAKFRVAHRGHDRVRVG